MVPTPDTKPLPACPAVVVTALLYAGPFSCRIDPTPYVIAPSFTVADPDAETTELPAVKVVLANVWALDELEPATDNVPPPRLSTDDALMILVVGAPDAEKLRASVPSLNVVIPV